jgi:hypothetical protein
MTSRGIEMVCFGWFLQVFLFDEGDNCDRSFGGWRGEGESNCKFGGEMSFGDGEGRRWILML